MRTPTTISFGRIRTPDTGHRILNSKTNTATMRLRHTVLAGSARSHGLGIAHEKDHGRDPDFHTETNNHRTDWFPIDRLPHKFEGASGNERVDRALDPYDRVSVSASRP